MDVPSSRAEARPLITNLHLAAEVRYDNWLRFATPITLLLYALGAIA